MARKTHTKNIFKRMRWLRRKPLMVLVAILLALPVIMPAQPSSAAACDMTESGGDVVITVDCELASGTYNVTDDFTVNTGVTVTAQSSGAVGVIINAGGNITITGDISADAQGYACEVGTGAGNNDVEGNGGSGGGHGGSGGATGPGNSGGVVYGSVTAPTTVGSGGGDDDDIGGCGGGSGGGAIKLAADGTLTIDGAVSANGQDGQNVLHDDGGGSGGSVWLDAASIAGSGTVTTNGGDSYSDQGGAGGGGGRIAIEYTADVSSSWTSTAYGGFGGNQGGFNAEDGGAGTIFMKQDSATNGDLIVKNNNLSDPAYTTQVTTSSQTYDNITISDGVEYIIPNAYTLALASGGTLTTGGTVQSLLGIENGGTFNSGAATFTIDDIDVIHQGDFDTVTNLTVTNATYTLYKTTATYSDTLTDLTVGASTTFVMNGTATTNLTNLTILNTGTLTHTTNSTSKAHVIDISSTNVDVQSGGTINVNSGGLTDETGSGAGTGSGGNSSGAGYGGNGGNAGAYTGGATYGSVTQPNDIGSGGGNDNGQNGGAGGGAIKIVATGTLTINGTISADGEDVTYDDGGGGSGGSVWLDGGTLAGTGTISADGGNGKSGDGGGGGGGGRIAIYYTDGNPADWTKQAHGGAEGTASGDPDDGGAGTVYVDDEDDAYSNGDLIVDNNNHDNSSKTTQVTTLSQTYDNITVSGGSEYFIPNTYTLTLVSGGTLTGGGTQQSSMTIENGGTFNTASAATFTINDIDIIHQGDFDTVTNLTVTNATYTLYKATATHSDTLTDLTVGTSATFVMNGTATTTLTNLTVLNTGTLTHSINSNSKAHVIDISATTVDIQSGGTVNVNTFGFQAPFGTGVGITTTVGSGGGYGGNGGNGYYGEVGGTTYGSVTQPIDLGSGGGGDSSSGGTSVGGDGGGAIKLTISGTFTLNGTISADGEMGEADNAAGGSGGSVWIDASTLSGTGTITTDGGPGRTNEVGAGGGGGRVSITGYSSGNPSSYTLQSYGGNEGSGSGAQGDGGAGTIYTKASGATNGDLVVDNNDHNDGSDTTQITSADLTFDNITIKSAAKYVIPGGSTETLTLASGGTFTAGGTTQSSLTIENGGTFNPASAATFTFNDIDIIHQGDFDTVTNLTVTNATYTLYKATATHSDTLTDLTVGASATFVMNGTATTTLTNLTVLNTGTLSHTTNSTAKSHVIDISATTVDIQNGGTVDVDGEGYRYEQGSGAGNNDSNSNTGSAAGYGGNGGISQSNTGGATYGSVTAPIDIGSGGGDAGGVKYGGSGGGAVKFLVSGTFTLNGDITADGVVGVTDAGGGSGGSVWVDADTLAGTGTITADGGKGNVGEAGGGAGGGRIAITSYSSGSPSGYTLQAYGGDEGTQGGFDHTDGGAGTIFTQASGATNGDIVVDNNNHDDGSNTTQITAADLTFDNITIKNGAKYVIPGTSTETLAINSGGTLTGGGTEQSSLTIDSGAVFDVGNATVIVNDIDVTNNGTVGSVTNLTVQASTFTHNGALSATITSLSLSSSGAFVHNGTGVSLSTLNYGSGTFVLQNTTDFGSGAHLTSLTLQSGGTFESRRTETIYIDTITVQSSGTMTHTANTTAKSYVLDVLATTINVQSSGTVSVNSKGYTDEEGTGAGTNSVQSSISSGAGYGGAGGDSTYSGLTNPGGITYGSNTEPDDLGSGGGNDNGLNGGAGGGAIKMIVSGTLTINGTVSADGEDVTIDDGGGGSGGSIWLQGDEIAGTGTFSVDGGNAKLTGSEYGGGGGGGRMAIYYGTGDPDDWTKTATGGQGGAQAGGLPGDDGTIYTESLGGPPVANDDTGYSVNEGLILTVNVASGVLDNDTDPDTDPLTADKVTDPGQGSVVLASDGSFVYTPPSDWGGTDTFTYRAYDGSDYSTTNATVSIDVITNDPTVDDTLTLSRLQAGVSASVTLSFTLSNTVTGPLVVTFPAGFTVTTAFTSGTCAGGGSIATFGYTSTTLTAAKTNCTGLVSLSGAAVTNHSTPGVYSVSWINDDPGESDVVILADDTITVNAAVTQVFTFDLMVASSEANCTTATSSADYAIGLGTLTPGSVTLASEAICMKLNTNASGGAEVQVKSLYGALRNSASDPVYNLSSAAENLASGGGADEEGYGLCGSSFAEVGPAGTIDIASYTFDNSCSDVGAVSTSWTTLADTNTNPVSGGSTTDFYDAITLELAALASTVSPSGDYTDDLIFRAYATF